MRLSESRCCLVPCKFLASHFLCSSSLCNCLVSAACVFAAITTAPLRWLTALDLHQYISGLCLYADGQLMLLTDER